MRRAEHHIRRYEYIAHSCDQLPAKSDPFNLPVTPWLRLRSGIVINCRGVLVSGCSNNARQRSGEVPWGLSFAPDKVPEADSLHHWLEQQLKQWGRGLDHKKEGPNKNHQKYWEESSETGLICHQLPWLGEWRHLLEWECRTGMEPSTIIFLGSITDGIFSPAIC